MPLDWVKLSKTLAHALRHQPELYGLNLDAEGWVSVADLLAGLKGHSPLWQNLTAADIRQVVSRGDKPRYEIHGEKIRALHGHSVAQKIEKTPSTPPPKLYHGTKQAVLAQILQEGLKAMSRQYVHLSVDTQMAQQVGSRGKGVVVILEIDAASAHQEGIQFYQTSEAVWLADEIPPEYIQPLT